MRECERALLSLAARLAAVDPEVRSRYAVSRSLSCTVADLDVVFRAQLGERGLDDVRCEDGPGDGTAQVRLATSSDDLVALVHGTLSPPVAWATGRLRIEASVLDLLKLRAML